MRYEQEEDAKGYDDKAFCRSDESQLPNGVKLAGSRIGSRCRKKGNSSRNALGDTRECFNNGTSQAGTKTQNKKECIQSGEIDPLTLPYLMMTELKFLPTRSGVYFAIEESGQVAYIGQSINIRQRWQSHHV